MTGNPEARGREAGGTGKRDVRAGGVRSVKKGQIQGGVKRIVKQDPDPEQACEDAGLAPHGNSPEEDAEQSTATDNTGVGVGVGEMGKAVTPVGGDEEACEDTHCRKESAAALVGVGVVAAKEEEEEDGRRGVMRSARSRPLSLPPSLARSLPEECGFLDLCKNSGGAAACDCVGGCCEDVCDWVDGCSV